MYRKQLPSTFCLSMLSASLVHGKNIIYSTKKNQKLNRCNIHIYEVLYDRCILLYLFRETVDGVNQELRQQGHEARDHRQANESTAQLEVCAVLVGVGEQVGVGLELPIRLGARK